MSHKLSADFFDHYPTWFRLEGRCRTSDISEGLKARIADPLWMLGRQWQMGEFQAEDNGSPIEVEVEYQNWALKYAWLGDYGQPQKMTTGLPLETLVERMPVQLDWRLRVLIGRQFERFLKDETPDSYQQNLLNALAYLRQTLNQFPTAEERAHLDDATQRFLRMLTGKIVDGGALLEAIENGTLPTLRSATYLGNTALRYAINRLQVWYGKLTSQPDEKTETAWDPQRLEHRFRLTSQRHSQAQHHLETPSYRNGELDWYSCDAAEGRQATDTIPAQQGPRVTNFAIVDVPRGAELEALRENATVKVPHQGINIKANTFPEEVGSVVFEINGTRVMRNTRPFLLGPIPPSRAAGWKPASGQYILKATPYSKKNGGGSAGHPLQVNFKAQVFDNSRPTVHKENFVPTRVNFAGMPHRRWWALEDHNISFGEMEVNTTDLSKLFLIQFALTGSDDWFMAPLTLPLGSLTRVRKLQVSNVFGQSVEIEDSRVQHEDPLKVWDVFELTGNSDQNLMFLAPVAGYREESQVLEQVNFVRDEGANMVWAIEKVVRNGLGQPVEASEAISEAARRDSQSEEEVSSKPAEMPKYSLATPVPSNLIPYLPIRRDAASVGFMLRQARVLRNEQDQAPTEIEPKTRILAPDLLQEHPDWVYEESIPRCGIDVQLTKQRLRWVDGSTVVWIGRSTTSSGKKPGLSLIFDSISE